MPSGCYRFERFSLDPHNRHFKEDYATVEINARYLDALILLVREQGQLITKERFFQEVWQGARVSDEALTQCIKTLRKQLGDSASNPRFIETVPKHGYRFIAPAMFINEESPLPVEPELRASLQATSEEGEASEPKNQQQEFTGLSYDSRGATVASFSMNKKWLLTGAGTVGAGISGIVGGIFFGFAASQPMNTGMGSLSALVVLVCLTELVALVGGAGVALGIAFGGFKKGKPTLYCVLGGAMGGLLTGAFVKLLGLDAFRLLLGQSPTDITGGFEGMLLGAAVGLGLYLGARGVESLSVRRCVGYAALCGVAVGTLLPLLGGRLMGGSLDLLVRSFPDSRLRLDSIGNLFGENGFGPISQIVTGGVEGALFAGGIVGAMALAHRHVSARE